jgi:guanylate kinase
MQVRYHYPDALLMFILPPDEQTLVRRLTDRGRDSDDAIQKRYRAAKREIAMAKGSRAFDYMVINDSLDAAVEEIVKIVHHKRNEHNEND